MPTKTYNGINGQTLVKTVDDIYQASTKWRKNQFLLPTGQCGKDCIKLSTEWLNQFNNKTCFEGIALKVLMVIPNLMLQKPSARSKTKDHSERLTARLKLWNEGKLNEIWKEVATIQKKLQASKKKQRTDEDISRVFSKLMLEGKVGAALKFLEEQSENAVLKPTADIIKKLEALHPEANTVEPETLIQGPREEVPPAYFYCIDELHIFKAANQTKGSGGPSQQDAQQWKRMLCSNKFKSESKDLREEMAKFARRIASETIDPSSLEAYVAGRLIPLNKNPGGEDIQVRPIGLGEVMRRIVGKAISWCLQDDIQQAAGPLQVSAGLKGGAEAAIQYMQ